MRQVIHFGPRAQRRRRLAILASLLATLLVRGGAAAVGLLCHRAAEVICRRWTVEIWVGIHTYAAEHGGRLPAANQPLEICLPGHEDTLHCPLDREGRVSYALNPAFGGWPLDRLSDHRDAVLVYEADMNGRPVVRHEQFHYATASGASRSCPPEAVGSLDWGPEPKPPWPFARPATRHAAGPSRKPTRLAAGLEPGGP